MDILIIDDNQSHQLLLTTFLHDIGYTVHTADHGQQALAYLRQSADRPKLMLLDIAMPVMTGWEFIRALQSDTRLAAIPVVIMSALGVLEHQGIPESVVALLEKPLDLLGLEKLLRVYAQPGLQVRAVGG